jgi:DNA-binding transcriptional MerR regulator
MNAQYTISQVAAASGVNICTIKTWRQINKLSIGKTSGGWVRYNFDDALVLAVVGRLNRRGFCVENATKFVSELGTSLYDAPDCSIACDETEVIVDLDALRARGRAALNLAG